MEKRFSPEEEAPLREQQKRGYDKHVSDNIPELSPGGKVLVRKGLGKSRFFAPFTVTDVKSIEGIPKGVNYTDGYYTKHSRLTKCSQVLPRGDRFSGWECRRLAI